MTGRNRAILMSVLTGTMSFMCVGLATVDFQTGSPGLGWMMVVTSIIYLLAFIAWCKVVERRNRDES